MIALELARFLAICLGLISGWVIFQIVKPQLIHNHVVTKKQMLVLIPALAITLLGSVLLQVNREPQMKKISYRLTKEEAKSLNLDQSESRTMQIRRNQPDDRLIFLQPVYKEHLLGTVLLLTVLLVGNRKNLNYRFSKQSASNNGNRTAKPLPNLNKDEVLANLHRVLKEDELYTNPLLNLDELATTLDVSKYHLSQLINQELGKNFYELVNDYRVDASKALMQSSNHDHLTLSALGLEVGFNSKASFYRAFKRKTGQTPAAYKKSLKVNEG